MEIEYNRLTKLLDRIKKLEAENRRILDAASGYGMPSEMDNWVEVTLLVSGLYTRIEELEQACKRHQETIRSQQVTIADLERTLDEHFLERKEPDYIEDGFGNRWPVDCPRCGAPMQVIRLGDCRCSAECYITEEEKQS